MLDGGCDSAFPAASERGRRWTACHDVELLLQEDGQHVACFHMSERAYGMASCFESTNAQRRRRGVMVRAVRLSRPPSPGDCEVAVKGRRLSNEANGCPVTCCSNGDILWQYNLAIAIRPYGPCPYLSGLEIPREVRTEVFTPLASPLNP